MKNVLILLSALIFNPISVWSQLVKYDKRFMQPNGPVFAIEADSANNQVFVGGQFEYFTESRYGMFAVDTGASLIDRNFPQTNARINVIVSDRNDGIIVAGDFTSIKNVPCNNIAQISKYGIVTALPGIISLGGGVSGNDINDVFLVGNRLFIRGKFVSVNGVPSSEFFYNLDTDELSFTPFPISKSIRTIEVLQDTLAYVSTIDSLILVNLNTMQKVSSFTPVRVNNYITDFEIIGDTLFFSGYFSTVNGVGRNLLASVNRLNGSLLSFDPAPNGNVSSIGQNEGMLLVAGSFTHIGGQARNRFAVLSPVTGGANFVNFPGLGIVDKMVLYEGRIFFLSTNISNTPINERFRVYSLQSWEEDYWEFHCVSGIQDFIVKQGRVFAFSSSINEVGHVYAKNIARIDLQTGYPSPLVKGINQRVTSLHLKDGKLYCGGYFNVFGDSIRKGAAAIHLTNNQVIEWDPFKNSGYSTNPTNLIVSYKGNLFIGGNFSHVRDSAFNNLAMVDAQNGYPIRNLRVNNEVHTIVFSDTFIYLGGAFSSVLNQSRLRIAQLGYNSLELTNWQPNVNGIVKTIFVDENHVYVGGKYSSIGGFTRSNIAQLNKVTGSVTSWNYTLSDTVYNIRQVNDSIISISGCFLGSNWDNWVWVKKSNFSPYKNFDAIRNVLGDMQVKNFTIGYGHFTSLRYTGSDNSSKRFLAFFKTCEMPEIPIITGDTIACSNSTKTYSIGNSQLNDAENWSWSTSFCNATGSLKSDFTIKHSISDQRIYVRPVGECSSDDYCSDLYVIVKRTSSANYTLKLCDNSYPYVVNGKSYFGPGKYQDTLVNQHGCDSFLNITLSNYVSDSVFKVLDHCDSMLIGGLWRTLPGNYIDTLTNRFGCDSIVFIDLRLKQSIKTKISATACDSFRISNQVFTSSGIYQIILSRTTGCDSVVELNLTVNNSTQTKLTINACNSYDFFGLTINKSGDYQKVLQSSSECDSIIDLKLTVISNQASILNLSGNLRGFPTGAGKYDWLDCNNNFTSVFSSITDPNFTPSKSGFYAVAVTKDNCIDTSDCFAFNGVGISTVSQNGVKLYPNPTSSNNEGIWLQADEHLNKEFVVYTIHGKEIFRSNLENNHTFIPLIGAKTGTYLVYIISNNGIATVERFALIP